MSEILAPTEGAVVEAAPYDPHLFHTIAQQAQDNYGRLYDGKQPLFRVGLKKGTLFDVYLNNLPAEIRQQMNCSCCRGFLNRFGGLVTVSTEEGSVGQLKSVLWNIPEDADQVADPRFTASIAAMKALVEKTQVEFTFLTALIGLGDAEKGGFEHFSLVNAAPYKTHDENGHRITTTLAHQIVADQMQHAKNLAKFAGTTDQALLDAVATFFENDQRLKGQDKWVKNARWIAEFKRTRDLLTQNSKKAYLWYNIATQGFGRMNVYKTPLATFIDNIAKGNSYDVATRKFLEMTAGDNYLRPKAPPKTGTVKRAETVFQELNLGTALERRLLTQEEMRCKIWTAPAQVATEQEAKPLFGHLATKEDKPKTPELPVINSGAISLQRFLAEVLPDATELYFDYGALPRGQHYAIASFVTATDPDARPILYWDKDDDRNPVSGYTYVNGTIVEQWGFKPYGKTKIVAVMVDPKQWDKDEKCVSEFDVSKHSLVFVLEEGRDINLQGTPMFATNARQELHEVRAVMESFFRTKNLTPLQEGQKPVVGVQGATNGMMLLPIQVVKNGAIVRYLIDRSH